MTVLSKPARDTPALASIHHLPIEIIWLVTSALPNKDQARLARTCRYMSEAVRETLWRQLDDLMPLFNLLPKLTTGPDVRNGWHITSSTSSPMLLIRQEQVTVRTKWNRWDLYAPCVHGLTLERLPVCTRASLRHLITSRTQSFGSAILLPNLQSLSIRTGSLRPVDATFLGLLFSPVLTHLETSFLRRGYAALPPSSSSQDGILALCKKLTSAWDGGVPLTSLELHVTRCTEPVQNAIAQLVAGSSSLVSLTLTGSECVDERILVAASKLPKLQYFSHPLFTRLSSPPHPPSPCFPSLKTVKSSADIVAWTLDSASNPSDISVDLLVEMGQDSDPLLQLESRRFARIQEQFPHVLKTLSIVVQPPRPASRPTASRAPIIEHLLDCENLTSLTILGALGHDIGNIKYARKWTKLQALVYVGLDGEYVDLKALGALSRHCPSLRLLNIPVDASTSAVLNPEEDSFQSWRHMRELDISQWLLPRDNMDKFNIVGILSQLRPGNRMERWNCYGSQYKWITLPMTSEPSYAEWRNVLVVADSLDLL